MGFLLLLLFLPIKMILRASKIFSIGSFLLGNTDFMFCGNVLILLKALTETKQEELANSSDFLLADLFVFPGSPMPCGPLGA